MFVCFHFVGFPFQKFSSRFLRGSWARATVQTLGSATDKAAAALRDQNALIFKYLMTLLVSEINIKNNYNLVPPPYSVKTQINMIPTGIKGEIKKDNL